MSDKPDRAQFVREQIRLSLAKELAERSLPVVTEVALTAAVARLGAR